MHYRTDKVEIVLLQQLGAAAMWFQLCRVLGHGSVRLIDADLKVPAFAWRSQDTEPVLQPGPWHIQIALTNGMIVQPMIRIVPNAAGFVPAGGNISDWWTEGNEIPAGLVCYSSRWDPTHHTLVWAAQQVARIITGEVFHMEAAPLSRRGRDWQAEAMARGKLPVFVLPPVPEELLFLCAETESRHGASCEGIEFDVA